MGRIDKIVYLGLSGLTSALGCIPLKTGVFFSNVLGSVWFAMDKQHRKVTLDNLMNAYGSELVPTDIKQMAKQVFINSVRMIFEYAWFYRLDPKQYGRYFTFNGIGHVLDASKKGKGVLGFTAHLGNWELSGLIGPATGLPMAVVYRKIKSSAVDRFVRENRERFGCRMLVLHNALAGILKALDRGDLIGLLVDQNSGLNSGVFVDFFGRKACANKGLARLALSTGAPVVPIFIFREKGRFILECQPELPLVRTGNEKKDIKVNTQLYNTVIESMVRRYPEQWFWMHDRWKTRPEHIRFLKTEDRKNH